MQDIFKVYNSINCEILKMQDYLLNYQINMPDIIGKYYNSMPEHEEIEDYLKEMDYACYNKLISNKLIHFVRKSNAGIEELKKEKEFLEIARNSVGCLIEKLAKVKKEELELILNKFNYNINIKDEYIYLYQYVNNILSLNVLIDSLKDLKLQEFFIYYINLKYRKKDINLVNSYSSYLSANNKEENFSLTK